MVSGGMAGQHYCLRWNNYQSNMTSVFHQLLQNEAFVDVTLACNEASLKAHKVVLSACSSYFQKLLLSNPCKHPTIIMPQDVCFSDLKFIIEFVYRGEIDVSQAELQSLLKTADQLKIKGLCEVPESKDGPPSVSLSSPPREPGSQRFNFTRLKRPYPRYKRTRTSFEPRATDSRHYDRYKEEEDSDSYHRKNKENRRDWQVEDEECTEVAAAAAVVLESCQRNSNNSTNNANGTNNNNNNEIQNCDTVKIKFETLHTMDSSDTIDIDSHMSDRASVSSKNAADSDNMMMITPELLGLMPSGSSIHSDSGENNSRGHSGQSSSHHHGNKSWTQEDMDAALEALRNHDMSLTKASAAFGIPSTTLWQRAHRLGIDTPKKDGPTKSWSDESLNNALEALRTGTISANKASKAFGIPSSTLYKIARREGIRLAAPFNASPTTWTPADLDRALEAIRSGQTSVQRASTEFGIPTGTLYGRCKREGIELSRSNPTPWSEDAMTEALEAVRLGHMSINQAAIHYNLPYSSLYGRFKRGKYEEPVVGDLSQDGTNSHFHQSPTQNHSSTIPDQMSYQGS
ncbi:PREDICTED: broad-complex core protein isoforms 1/2/3/4/5 isoform X4 [Polistes canadensis]|uniref:broad-complex core protein isoforms 1/2/3/4/5 isoform X4 n=1 Tax=Polistes canadensis TaxID=91411 RepID=UPI000718C3B1|nr:PREDICTED: broad-complex core protein isoforms 1/2/3/4/5 isoform X4 [Polistes canadensis]